MIAADALVVLHVQGLPVPQGSMRTFVVKGRPVVTSANKNLAGWRRLIADMAQGHLPAPTDSPVVVDMTFSFPKPKSSPKRRLYPDGRPDLDKCVRAVLDAITHILITDDSRVVGITARKVFGPPGVTLELRRAG